jgi:hypothetical protein
MLLLLFLWLYSPMLGLGCLFGFLILYTVDRTPWTGDQPVARPLPTQHNTHTYIHTFLKWDSNPRIQCLKTVHALGCAATVISYCISCIKRNSNKWGAILLTVHFCASGIHKLKKKRQIKPNKRARTKLALTSPTSGGRSVGIVRLRTEATEFSLIF